MIKQRLLTFKSKFLEKIKKNKKVFAIGAALVVVVAGLVVAILVKPSRGVAEAVDKPTKQVEESEIVGEKVAEEGTEEIEVEVGEEVEITEEEQVVVEPEEQEEVEKEDNNQETKPTNKKEEVKKPTNSEVISKPEEPKKEEPKQPQNNTTTQKPADQPKEEPKQPTNNTTPQKPAEQPKEEQKPTHTHNWVAQYREVDNGYWDEIVIEEAWTEYKDVYETKWRILCNGCNLDITNDTTSHGKSQALAGNYSCGSYRTVGEDVKVGTETIEHAAITEKVWVPKIEKELTGYKCSCGATK